MPGFILSLFLILIIFVVYSEYKNEKKYQESRRQKYSNKPEKKASKTKLEKASLTPKLPEVNYPDFNHNRLIEMGLSEDEAKAFVVELIPQIEEQIPLLEKAVKAEDYVAIERLTHSLKGSATNIGSGGVSDLLIEYNTYLKTGDNYAIVQAYLKHLIDYTQALKLQYN